MSKNQDLSCFCDSRGVYRIATLARAATVRKENNAERRKCEAARHRYCNTIGARRLRGKLRPRIDGNWRGGDDELFWRAFQLDAVVAKTRRKHVITRLSRNTLSVSVCLYISVSVDVFVCWFIRAFTFGDRLSVAATTALKKVEEASRWKQANAGENRLVRLLDRTTWDVMRSVTVVCARLIMSPDDDVTVLFKKTLLLSRSLYKFVSHS